jgi:NTP pyrophosphatase (non-canonical NTP hydrolase)
MEVNKEALRAVIQEAYETAKSKGWHDKPGTTFGDRIALIHSEASEALEAFRETGDPCFQVYRADGKPEGVPSELADIVIRVFDLAGAHSIDLATAILEKMEFNKTRPHRHGGKHL